MTSAPMPPIGLGTASLALINEDEALATIEHAIVSGIGYFDTAPLYGGGLAEERLGKALRRTNAKLMVSTKCGRYRAHGAPPPLVSKIPDTWDFSEATTRSSVERTMERLGRDFIDLVFLHDPENFGAQAFSEALPLLREFQNKGQIGQIGVGCNSVKGALEAFDARADDAILIAGRWTLMDRSASPEILERASAQRTNLIVGGVLNSGCLVDPFAPNLQFDYRPATKGERSRAQALAKIAAEHQVSLLAAALQFPSRDDRVSTTLLGAANRSQLDEALLALKEPVPKEFWQAVR